MSGTQVVHVAGLAGGDLGNGDLGAPAVHAAVAQDAPLVVGVAYHDLYTPHPPQWQGVYEGRGAAVERAVRSPSA